MQFGKTEQKCNIEKGNIKSRQSIKSNKSSARKNKINLQHKDIVKYSKS